MNRLGLWIVIGAGLVFAAGAGVGYVVARDPGAGGNTFLGQLVDQYDLRDDQVTRVRALLEAEGAAIDRILAGVEGQVRDEIQQARAKTEEEIRGVLDDEQRAKYDRDRVDGNG